MMQFRSLCRHLFPNQTAPNTLYFRIYQRFTHAKSLNRYFANKDFKRVCRSCGKPNILPVLNCTRCDSALTDECIQRVLHDPVADAIIDTEHDFTSVYRNFNLLVVKDKQPISDSHILIIPKKGLYDLCQLRRLDLKLLRSMQEKAYELLEVDPLCDTSKLIMGFHYPSAYSHVCMHAALPPFRMAPKAFQPPYFYSFAHVVQQLQDCGRFLPNVIRLTQRRRET